MRLDHHLSPKVCLVSDTKDDVAGQVLVWVPFQELAKEVQIKV